jgi:hypothetical protein
LIGDLQRKQSKICILMKFAHKKKCLRQRVNLFMNLLVNRDEYFAFHHCIIFNQNLHHDGLMSCGHILLRSWWNVLLSNYLQSWFGELGTDSCPQHWNYSLKARPGQARTLLLQKRCKKWCNTCCMDFVILKHGLL